MSASEPMPPLAHAAVPTQKLDPLARQMWDETVPLLERMRVLTEADLHILEQTCEAYAEYWQAKKRLRRRGLTYESPTVTGGVIIRPRPEVAIASDAWRRLRQGLMELGMTPASRTRVAAAPSGKSKDADAQEREAYFGVGA